MTEQLTDEKAEEIITDLRRKRFQSSYEINESLDTHIKRIKEDPIKYMNEEYDRFIENLNDECRLEYEKDLEGYSNLCQEIVEALGKEKLDDDVEVLAFYHVCKGTVKNIEERLLKPHEILQNITHV